MTEENKPRFSHITVGQESVDEASQPDEEVITIGAVGKDVAGSGFEDASAEPDVPEPIVRANDFDEGDRGDIAHSEVDASTDDSDFGGPMPMPQKIVIGVCLIGFVLVVAWLIWFWVFPQ